MPPPTPLPASIRGPPLPHPLPHIKPLLLQTVKQHAHIEALVSLHQTTLNLPGFANKSTPHPQHSRLAWTYQQLYDGAETLANRLTARGVRRGNNIAIISDACAEWALFCWAGVLLGCPFAPIDPRVVTRGEDVRRMLEDIGASVIVVGDGEAAGRLEEEMADELAAVRVKVVLGLDEGGMRMRGWMSLLELWEGEEDINPPAGDDKERVFNEDTVIIGFTSGSTSFPKACPQSSDNLVASSLAVQKVRYMGPSDRLVQHLPPFAAMAVLISLTFWISGATIVYPAARFSIPTTLDAIEREKCTYMFAVPTMVKALAMQHSIQNRDLSSLRVIDLGGATTYPEILNLCISPKALQSKSVGCGWGMTETPAPLFTDLYHEQFESTESPVPVGKAIPGSAMRVCAPGSQEPLLREEEGELHVGGVTVICGYINGDNETFYSDGGMRWIATGDMAKIDDSGAVHILGRYKDIIIRGGQNIAPARIERCLDKIPGVESQVVGIPDEIAGDIPIVVVKLSGDAADSQKETFEALKELSLRELGTTSAPQMFLNLKTDLGRETFPSTISGKLRKTELAEIVQKFVLQNTNLAMAQSSKSTEHTLSEIWSEVSGLSAGSIDTKISIFVYVDSITTMRFSSAVTKRLQKMISVEDVTKHPSICEQAKLLDSRPVLTRDSIQQRTGPPSVDDMVHCHGEMSKAKRTQELANPMLKRLGLTWQDDVEDVFPAPDTSHIYLWRRRPQTWNQRAVYIAQNIDHDRLVDAWKATLQRHAMFRTITISYDDQGIPEPQRRDILQHSHQMFIVVRANHRFWDRSLHTGLHVDKPEELRAVFGNVWGDSACGPLVRVAFARIQNTNSSAFIFVGNHGAYDNLSMNMLLEDLGKALDHGLTTEDMLHAPGHTPFKRFADAYYIHRSSASAMGAVAFHANRLRGIGNFKSSLWPPLRAPGAFKGEDDGWTGMSGELGDPALRIPLDDPPNRYGLDGLTCTAGAGQLDVMRRVYGILPHVILKAAVALFNTARTSSNTALFANVEAGRAWPFVDDWTTPESRAELPNPLDIAGPMFHVVVNRIDVSNRAEKVLDLLRRIQDEQVLLSRYSQAPLFEIQRSLDSKDAEVMSQAMSRQGYNWAPGIQSAASERNNDKPQTLAKFQRKAYDDICLAWTCGLWDAETFYINASYDDCQFSKAEALQAMQEVLCAGVWLANPDNVEREIEGCVFEGLAVGGLIKSLE
ncbi:NRPS [Onygenales sp. PD_10]|nr:NRPS [Onygenales sp. PD_10]